MRIHIKVPGQNVLTGLAGVYFVAAELSLRNYVVAVTSRNAPGVDIIAVSPNSKRTITLQIKASRGGGTQTFWLLGQKSKNEFAKDYFYVFVNLKTDGQRPDYYIVPSRIVARDMDIDRRTKTTWYSFYRDDKYKDKWNSLPS